MKTLKRFFLLLLIIELILVGFYCAFQPQCEPCLPNEFCLPCQSKTQITIQTLALTRWVKLLQIVTSSEISVTK